mgnify:CR=1 FL=1
MPPRTAYSPGSRTVEARTKPLSSSQSTIPCMPMTLPGATDSACVADKVARRHALERGIDGRHQH